MVKMPWNKLLLTFAAIIGTVAFAVMYSGRHDLIPYVFAFNSACLYTVLLWKWRNDKNAESQK